MRQYCRYCVYMCVGDVPFCRIKQETMPDKRAKNVNNCKQFELCEVDAYDLKRRYRPRSVGRKPLKGQMRIEDYEKGLSVE